MKLQKKRQPIVKRPVFWVVAIVLLALIGAGGYYLYRHNQHTDTAHTSTNDQNGKISYGPPTQDQTKAGQDIKQQNIQQQGNPPTSTDLSLSFSRARQNGAGQPVSVYMIVSGTATGRCVLSFTMSGQQTVTKTADVTAGATYNTCQVDVPASSFPISGGWSLSAYVTNDKSTSTTVSWAGNPVNVQK